MSPLANRYLRPDQLGDVEQFYPLHAFVCGSCFLVQLEAFQTPQHLFGDYAYFSSYSESWLAHSKAYVEQVTARFGLDGRSQVVEIASNDGYLLQYFNERGIPVLGIEPAANVAEVAVRKGIPSRVAFFGLETAARLQEEGLQADLLLGNNVLAHVPDLNDFVAGLAVALKPTGVVTMEFPHLLRLILGNQFDTIYHEHFSYFSLTVVANMFARHGLTVFDVEELPTHGGSLRVYAGHSRNFSRDIASRVADVRELEHTAGLSHIEIYEAFGDCVRNTKRDLLTFLIDAKRAGLAIAGYGAPAKGNTLLNYCGIRTDLLEYTVDRSPHKQGLFLPGTHIPIFAPERLRDTRPDLILILPWNLKNEVMDQMAHVREWGGRFVTAIPGIEVS